VEIANFCQEVVWRNAFGKNARRRYSQSERTQLGIELCRQAYIFLVILKHERRRRRRRDSDHYFLSLATQETTDYVYTS